MPTWNVSSLRAATLACVVSLAAGFGNVLLLHFSQFGSQPHASLPALVVMWFGLMFTGLLQDIGAVTTRSWWPWLGGAAGIAAVALFDPQYAIAPLVAWGAASLLLAFPARIGAMLGAMTVYVTCTVLANYTLDSFLPIGGFLLLNVGTLFFGITFTQRDRVHIFGRGPVYAMIFVAAVANVLAALSLDTPLRYVAVSMLSILLSETADTEIYQRLIGRRWLTRVLSSNAVSAPLDTIVFTLLAFVGQPFATGDWLARVIVTDIVVKFGSGLVAALGLVGLARIVAVRTPTLPFTVSRSEKPARGTP